MHPWACPTSRTSLTIKLLSCAVLIVTNNRSKTTVCNGYIGLRTAISCSCIIIYPPLPELIPLGETPDFSVVIQPDVVVHVPTPRRYSETGKAWRYCRFDVTNER